MERLSIGRGRTAHALFFGALIAAVLAFAAASASPALAADTTEQASTDNSTVTQATTEPVVVDGDTTDPVVVDGTTVTQDGNVTVEVTSDDNKNAVQATNGANVTVNGNVTVKDSDNLEESHGANGVWADDSTVKTENVSATGHSVDAVDATNNANITTEDVSANGYLARGVSASDSQVASGRVNVDGNYSTGVDANADSMVTADSITVEGSYAQAANLSSNASLTVNGDVVASGTGADGIVMEENPTGTAVVEGDVSADSYGAVIQLISSKQWGNHGEQGSYPGSAVLVVEGDLSGDTAPLAIIPFYFTTGIFGTKHHYFYDLSDYEESDFPTIIVSSLTAKQNLINAVVYNNDDEAYYTPVTDEQVEALKAAVLKNVYYIVKTDGFTVTGAKSITVNGKTYLVAQDGDELTLTPIVPSGYTLDSTDFGIYTATKQADGSYLVTAKLGGNLVFSATVKAVPSDPEPSDDPDEPTDNPEPAINPESTDNPASSDNETIKAVNASKTAPVSTSAAPATEAAASSAAIPTLGDDAVVPVWLLIIAMLSAAICAGAAYRKFAA